MPPVPWPFPLWPQDAYLLRFIDLNRSPPGGASPPAAFGPIGFPRFNVLVKALSRGRGLSPRECVVFS